MYRFTWNRWLKSLDGRRGRTVNTRRSRLAMTHLESRDVPSAFTPGDIVVYRIGDGSPAPNGFTSSAGNLNVDAAPVFLDEYTPAGVLKQSIELPTTGSNALTEIETSSATGTTNQKEGLLTDSADGRFLVIPGYNAPVGTATLYNGNSTRAVDLVGLSGTVTSQTVDNLAQSNIRSATTADGTVVFSSDYWPVSATTGGPMRAQIAGTTGPSTGISDEINYITGTVTMNSGSADPAGLEIYNGQLYMTTSQSDDDGVNSVATGLPVTPGNTTTNVTNILPGFPTAGVSPFPSPEQFVFTDANTLYVADARTNGQGGLQKWTNSGGVWNLQYTIPMPTSATEGLISVAYYGTDTTVGPNFGDPIFYGVTYETSSTVQNKLVAIEDTGSATLSTANVLATAPAATGTNGSTSSQEYFKSVALVPTTGIGATADTIGVTTSGSPAPYGSSVTFTATVTGTTTVPTGYVTFEDTSTSPATMVGIAALTPGTGNTASAQFTTSSLSINSPGTYHTIEAVYGGDGAYAANNNSIQQVISGTTTTTVVTSNSALPTTAGVIVTFTATVAPNFGASTPTGTVAFDDNSLPITGTVNYTTSGTSLVATVTETTSPTQGTSLLNPGSHTITAVYTPTGNFAASDNTASPLIQNVKVNAFGVGDLLVYRDGDGTSTINDNTDSAVYIDEYNPSTSPATLVQSIVMPTTSVAGGNQALTTDAFNAAEGELSFSSNGQNLLLTGYDAVLSLTNYPDNSAAATTPRTIGEISSNGTINTSMALTDAADGGSIRGAAMQGSQIYVAGSTGGVRYVNGYTAGLITSTQIDTGNNNTTSPLSLQSPMIAGGQLYVSDSSTTGTVNPTIKIAAVGTGLPTTAGQSDTTIPGLPDPSTGEPANPVGYYFTDLGVGPFVGPNTLYVANDGANFYGGDITKWTLISGIWMLNGTIPSGGTDASSPVPSFNYVTGAVSGGTVTLYATFGLSGAASAGGGGGLYSIVDNSGYNSFPATTPTIATLASESNTSNEIFRGVVVVPTPAPTVSGVTVSDGVAADGTTQRSEVRQIAVTFSGPVTFTGGNSNAAAAFQLKHLTDGNNVTLSAAVGTNGSGQTTVTLTFSGAETDSISAENGGVPSLADGQYQLTILSANVSGAGGALAGGGAGGNYVSPTDTLGGGAGELGLFRLFGDATGNGVVDQLDLAQFRAANNSTGPGSPYVAYLDADNSGTIDQLDLAQFRARNNSNVFGV